MGTTHHSLPVKPPVIDAPLEPPPARPARASLPPKGSCWYCEKPLDSVKRFCGKDCADAFDEEAEFTR